MKLKFPVTIEQIEAINSHLQLLEERNTAIDNQLEALRQRVNWTELIQKNHADSIQELHNLQGRIW